MPMICNMETFTVGSHVQVTGIIKYNVYSYIWVVRKEDIVFASDTRKTLREVLKGQQHIKRIKEETEEFTSVSIQIFISKKMV